MKFLPLLLLAYCGEEIEKPKENKPYQVYQHWIIDGKSYSNCIINFDDTTKIFKQYDGKLNEERYRNGVLIEVVEY